MSPSVVCDATTHPPGTHGDEGAIPAFVPGAEPVELCARGLAPRVAPVVDVAGRHRLLAGEARARVERAVRPDGVRVLHVDVARTVVHAVGRRESVASASRRGGTSSCRRGNGTSRTSTPPPAPAEVMHVPPSGLRAVGTDRSQRQHALLERDRRTGSRRRSPFRTIGLKFTLTSLSAKSCCLQELEQRRIAVRPSSRRSCRRWRSRTCRRRGGCSR